MYLTISGPEESRKGGRSPGAGAEGGYELLYVLWKSSHEAIILAPGIKS